MTSTGTSIVAYYDHYCSTILHINFEFMLKEKSKSTRCLSCREYRYVLKSTLRHLKIPEPGNACLQVDPRTNFRYLTTHQKLEKLRSLRDNRLKHRAAGCIFSYFLFFDWLVLCCLLVAFPFTQFKLSSHPIIKMCCCTNIR